MKSNNNNGEKGIVDIWFFVEPLNKQKKMMNLIQSSLTIL